MAKGGTRRYLWVGTEWEKGRDPETITPPPVAQMPYYLKPFLSGGGSGASYWNTTLRTGNTYYTATDPATVSFRAPAGNMNNDSWSWAVWYTKSTDIVVPVTDQGNTVTYTTIPVPSDWHVPPPNHPAQRDGWVTVVLPDGKIAIDLYKTWVVTDANGVVTRVWTTETPKRVPLDQMGHILNTTGINAPASSQGHRASRWPYHGGAVRKYEIMGAGIQHTLQVAIPNSSLKVGYVYPARGEDYDSTAYSGNCPMGTRLALPPTFNLGTIGLQSDEGWMLAEAAQKFGALVGDRSDFNTLTAERPNPKHSDFQSHKDAIARGSADWNRIKNHMVRVSGTSSTLPGGPGDIRWPDPPQGVIAPVS